MFFDLTFPLFFAIILMLSNFMLSSLHVRQCPLLRALSAMFCRSSAGKCGHFLFWGVWGALLHNCA